MGSTDLKSRKTVDGVEKVYVDGPSGVFGSLDVTVIQPQGQGDFVYGVSDLIFDTDTYAGASVTAAGGMCSVTTGIVASSWAQVKLRRGLKYRPGQGSLGRVTALFDTPVANNLQLVGLGNSESGYFVGYNGTDFGVLHQETGQVEVRALTISVGAGTGTVTVTLDGIPITVDIVGGGDTTQTAYQLATLGDYSQAGDGGFTADAVGSVVYFTAKRPNSTSTGTYSVSGASIVGTFAQTKAGTDPTLTFVAQSSMNEDRVDGTGPSGFTIDPQKGNVFQIEYQYLGFGNAKIGVEDPVTGKFINMHCFKNANARTTPVLKNPNSSVVAGVFNTGNTSAVTLKTVSMAGFIEGDVIKLDPKFAKSFGISNLNTSGAYKPLALLKANSLYNGETCYGEFDILRLAGSNQANNQTLTIGFFTKAIISGDVNYQYVDNQRSLVSIATLAPASNAISNLASLVPFYEIVVGGDHSEAQDLDLLEFVFGQGEELLIAVKTSGLLSGQVSINWFEQQ